MSADPPLPAPASDVWLRVNDALLSGMHHALNNRTAALTAVAQVLEGDLPESHPLRRALAMEVERLQHTVALIPLLAAESTARAEPVQVEELIGGAVELYRLHHDVRDLPCSVHADSPVLPLWVDRACLTRALLVALTTAAQSLRDAAGGEVEVRYRGDDDTVTITVAARGERETEREPDADPRALAQWLGEWGGTLEGGEDAYTIRMPTLPAVRRGSAGARL